MEWRTGADTPGFSAEDSDSLTISTPLEMLTNLGK